MAPMTEHSHPEAFLWVLSEPGKAVTLREFHDWYDNEHVPLRMTAIPEFLTGSRYEAIDGKKPTFSAFYHVSTLELFNQERYTNLRINRSARESALLARIGALERRTYQIIKSNRSSEDLAYSPLVVTLEFSAFDDQVKNRIEVLEKHTSCQGSQTCKIVDHSLIGLETRPSPELDHADVCTYMAMFEFKDDTYQSLPPFESLTELSMATRQWRLYRGWRNTSV